MRRMTEMDGEWYEERPTLEVVLRPGAISRMNLP